MTGQWGNQIEVPDKVLAQAEAMWKAGTPWDTIAKTTGYSLSVIRGRLDPEFIRRRRELNAMSRRRQWKLNPRPSSSGAPRVPVDRMRPEEVERVLATVPRDTRNFTSQFCGDPLPGRSALDTKRNGNSQDKSGIVHTTHSGVPEGVA